MAIGETNYREKTDTDHIEESIKEIKEDMNSNFLNIDTKLEELKKSVANGKNLIGNVVGGNQNSTFAILANNAQSIKNTRDSYASRVISLNSNVSNLKSQLTSLTTDRNNWKNIVNNQRITERTGTIKGTVTITKVLDKNQKNIFIFHGSSFQSLCCVLSFSNLSAYRAIVVDNYNDSYNLELYQGKVCYLPTGYGMLEITYTRTGNNVTCKIVKAYTSSSTDDYYNKSYIDYE